MADVVHACGHTQSWPGINDAQAHVYATQPCSTCTASEYEKFKAYLNTPVPTQPARRESDQKKGQ